MLNWSTRYGVTLLTVTTSHDTGLFIDDEGRASHGDPGRALQSFMIPLSDFTALLCQCSDQASGCSFIPLIVRPQETWDIVTLNYCANPNPLTAEPVATGSSALASDRTRIGPWERFRLTLIPVPETVLDHPVLSRLIREIREGSPISVTPDDVSLAQSLAQLELPHRATDLAQTIQASGYPAKLEGSADYWLGYSIPTLQRWLENRAENTSKRSIGPECDWFANYTHSLHRSTFVANVFLRGRVQPRHGACILASARNEGVYLLEWIAHHRRLGFEHFFIYSNDNDDGSDNLLEALATAGIVTWIRNELGLPVSPQVKAYGHALSTLPEILDYEWCLVVDTDEFMGLDTSRFKDVAQYLAWQGAVEVDAVALNWIWFGTFDTHNYEPGQLLTKRFLYRKPGPDKHIKSFIRPNFFSHSHPHYPTSIHPRVSFRDAAGANYEGSPEEFAFSLYPIETPAWIAHYWSKSLDEVLVKFSRGRGDMALSGHPTPASLLADVGHRVLHGERGIVPERDTRLLQMVPDLQAEIARLRDLPGVREAEQVVEAEFLRMIADLKHSICAIDPASIAHDPDSVLALSMFSGTALDVTVSPVA